MRVILDPILDVTVQGDAGFAVYEAIEDAVGNAVRRSITLDVRPYFMRVHADLTVRPFTDPASGAERWAVVVDNDDEALMRDFPARRHAVRFYEQLVRDVAADDRALHGGRPNVWDFTDVTDVTQNGGYGSGW